MAYGCEQCGTEFKKLSELLQHRRTRNHWRNFTCDVCGKAFKRRDNLERHVKKHKDQTNHHCDECGQCFSRNDNLLRHQLQKHQTGGGKKRPLDTDGDRRLKGMRKDDDLRNFYTIAKIREQRIEKFKTIAIMYKVNFKDLEVTELDDVLDTSKKLFSAIFKDLTKGAKSQDLIRLTVQSPSLDYPIVIPFLRMPELTVDRFMSEIERVLQSNEDFVIDESLLFEVTHVDMPNGTAQKRCKYVNTDRFLLEKRCVIRIQNDDDLCCARAIVTAKGKLDNHEKWESIRKGYKPQGFPAKQLHEQAGVKLGTCGIEEIKSFQMVLDGYQIHVVSKEHFNSIIYSGPDAERKIFLYHNENHYDVITSMTAFLSRNYFCIKCQKGYDHKEDHKCNAVCHSCRKVHDVVDEKWIQCDLCNRFFRGEECFALHRKVTAKGNSTCCFLYRCKECGKTVNKRLDKRHICGQTYCNTCKDFFGQDHRCYIVPEQNVKNFEEPMTVEEELIDDIEHAKTFL